MRVVLDTNVVISGIYYHGQPGLILDALGRQVVSLVLTEGIYQEYIQVADRLAPQFPEIPALTILEMMAQQAEFVTGVPFPTPICGDPDDDMFLAAAIASEAKLVVSGDALLLKCDGFHGVQVMKPRQFVDRHLKT